MAWVEKEGGRAQGKSAPRQAQLDAVFFLVSVVLSRLSTPSSVCEDSKIFMYAASVSWMVWSNSTRAWKQGERERDMCGSV